MISSLIGCSRNDIPDAVQVEQQAAAEEKQSKAEALVAAVARIDEVLSCGDVSLALRLSLAAEEIFGSNAQLTKQRQVIESTPTSTSQTKEIPLLPLLYKNAEELDKFMFMEEVPGRFSGSYFAQNKIVQEKDLNHALELSFSAEQLFGPDLLLWIQRSSIYDQLGKRTEAIAEMKKFLNTDPSAYNRIVKLYLKWDDKLMAIQTLEEAINDPRVKDNIRISRWGLEQARIYYEMGELKKAESRCEKTLRVLSAIDNKTIDYATSETLKKRFKELEKLMNDIKGNNKV